MKPVTKRKRKKGTGSSGSGQSHKKKPKKLTRFEAIARQEQLKRKCDLIYRVMMSKDTTELDKILQTFRETTLKQYSNISEMFRVQTKKTIEGKEHYSRIAKHGLFFFYLWMNPTYAQTLCSAPTPLVDPLKFERFYKTDLPNACQELLQTRITTLQAFVERVRTAYFTM